MQTYSAGCIAFVPALGVRNAFSRCEVLGYCHKPRRIYTTLRRAAFTCCTEMPSWKRGPVDVDFAKDEQLEILEESLGEALQGEDFQRASELRDKLLRLQSGAFVAVLSCNMKFYKAINSKSLVDIAGVWLQSSSSTCKHPGGPLVNGFMDIINSYGMMFSLDLPDIYVESYRINVRGTVAFITCDEVCYDEESGTKIHALATNLYTKYNAQWYLIHHSSFIVHPTLRNDNDTDHLRFNEQ